VCEREKGTDYYRHGSTGGGVYLSSFLRFLLGGSTRDLHRGSEGGSWDYPGRSLGGSGGLVPGQLCDLGLVGGVRGVVACILLIRVRHLIGLPAVEGTDPGIPLK
jgi:hypothetical protein